MGTFFTMSFNEGVFRIRIDQTIKGTIDQAWEWINCMHDIKKQLNRPFPLLTEVKHKVEFTSEARRVMRRVEDIEHFVAHAIWVNSIGMKAMVKFLMILVPRNLFDEDVFLQEAKAFSWLQDRIKQSVHQAITEAEALAIQMTINQVPN
jgi:hypothetical protein